MFDSSSGDQKSVTIMASSQKVWANRGGDEEQHVAAAATTEAIATAAATCCW